MNANDHNPFEEVASPTTNAVTLLAYGARGVWEDTAELIEDMHMHNGDAVARAITAHYQMIKYQEMPQVRTANNTSPRRRIGRSLARLRREEYAAIRVADVLLDRLVSEDVPGFVDAWDGVRYAFGGRNVVPVAAAVLMVVLGALEPEDEDANLLLDRLTADGTWATLLQRFTLGYDSGPDCG